MKRFQNYIQEDMDTLTRKTPVTYKRIHDLILKTDCLVVDINLIDVYENKETLKDKVAYTLRITFQPKERTLSNAEINGRMEKLKMVLEEKLDVKII